MHICIYIYIYVFICIFVIQVLLSLAPRLHVPLAGSVEQGCLLLTGQAANPNANTAS